MHNTRGISALANQPLSASSAPIAQEVEVGMEPVERPEPPIVQCGLYGVEMLSRGPCVNHAINVLVIDDVMWIWWYDRQGAIQTQGINFVQDLPRFLILLFAFQRFKLEDWGFNTILDPQSEIVHGLKKVHKSNCFLPESHFVFPPPELSVSAPVETTVLTKSPVYHVYSLVGRGTSVFSGTACTKAPPTRGSGIPQGSGKGPVAVDDISFATPDKDQEVVVKIYWPEESRLSEGRIISEAYKRGEGNLDIVEHLPKMYLEHDFPEHSTNHIRDALRLTWPDGRRATRILRLAIFLKLDPIIALGGEEFMKAYLDCVRCHFALWTLGIQHSDLSLSNVMINDQNRGILNDWDLATIEGISKHDGCDRTGTVPFMALELLNKRYWAGKIKRQYHHDLEGFLWILPYVCLQYKDGNMVTYLLESWNTDDYTICREKKSDFLRNLRTQPHLIPKATSSYKWEWVIFDQFVQRIDNNWQSPLTDEAIAAAIKGNMELATSVLNPGDVYAEFWARIKMAAEDDSGHLLYLKKYVPDGF
ncbi:hypothetical protein HETIRDRAFT_474620 [Heterobasidion irregulare TC 32-1]|uniref:Fungal-type protein kinase domain-containing protein n=1 Tax=Heterobasidion irregulare (strain TC 32-1) TaxID=747525 RepID=W4KCK6_HETIT|nr:uncharacterized protein HETIRDRAFT_474620 [Heterobasidion irregulare TC 32-1]ETW83474.1 hypothetical protein HETIRDRAFT_474620 [Heterobasidion irregulare TC 32-1]